jgi:hypothetical protein
MKPISYRIRLAGLAVILLVLSMGVQPSHAQRGKPLNEQEVLELLNGGVPSARVTEIVGDRGITFEFTSASEGRIRSAGGGEDLVAALRRLSRRSQEPEQPRGGSLRIQTTPGEAEVYINDEPKGITSPAGEIRLPNLKPGSYKVRVSLSGYQSWENTITIAAGENQTIPVTLAQRARVNPVKNDPAPPATGIPLPGLAPPVVQFFEGPHETMPAKSDRAYRSTFAKSSTRSIYWELDLYFARPGQHVNFKVMAHWTKPDGSEMGQQPLDAAVDSDSTTSSNALGWGWADAGNWPTGSYRVDFYAGDARVASGSFQISDEAPPAAQPKYTYPVTPSGIPVPGLKTPVVQFYEGPHDTRPEKSDRVYRYEFPKANTRTIYWEVDLNFPKPPRKIEFKLTAHWIKPDGSEMGQQSLDAYVIPEWGTSWHSLGWGWADAGNWPTGSYRVDFYVGSACVASGTFQVN